MSDPSKTNVPKTNKFGFRSIGTKPGPHKPPANGRGASDPTYMRELLDHCWE